MRKTNIWPLFCIGGVFLAMMGCSPKTTEAKIPDADSISSASVVYYYEDSALTQEQLLTDLALGVEKPGSITVATTNPNGTPNLAVVIPGTVNENTIYFSLADNQTSQNFLSQKTAVLSYYIYNPQESDKTKRNIGCRAVLQLVEDKAAIDAWNEGKENTEYNYYFTIVDILPLG